MLSQRNRNQRPPILFGDRNRRAIVVAGISAAALTLASAGGAHAQSQPTRGFYVGGAAGANLEEHNRFRNGGANATDTYDPGFVGTLDLGYGFGNGIRLELEPGYRVNQVDRINGAEGSGRTQIATLMANALYDFNDFKTPFLPLTPHIGLGVGYAHVWDRSGPQNGVGVSGGTDRPAFQAIGGLDYSLAPDKQIGLDYRYLLVHDASFHVNNGATTRAGDLNNHAFLITFRYEFNAPEAPPPEIPAAATTVAPPPPSPPPAAPRPYEVYFEFDRATLTPDARAVVRQAALKAEQGTATKIVATGHTDTVGTASYNLALSRRRAEAVRAELISDGVPANEIGTSGVGENDLAVATGPNVNEPRNRRVEILVQEPGA